MAAASSKTPTSEGDAAPARNGRLTPLQQAAYVLKETQARLAALEHARREPIAIIGAGCRFPGGADDLASYWRLLCEGVDAITQVPVERWDGDAFYDPDPAAPGKTSTRWGGFLQGVDAFDSEFFGMSPREAVRVDPQQRLLLEVAWEALENAGLPPDRLSGTQAGVFVGIIGNDYTLMQCRAIEDLDVFSGTGSAHSIAANRLSYVLNLRGPSIALDTACSSSLVTVHLACQSLRRGESDLALAGGVNLILGPELTIALSKARMMSADGRCKTFDAAADGYVRGEGCGLVVLKRLSDALAAGDRILAVIRGTAINHDGRSNGLSAPSGPAQEEVLRAALADAGLDAVQIGYVETHGTGTKLGDPIEFDALAAVMGPGRPASQPLVLGAVKTNIGHLESAAGIAGLIKAVLAMQHGRVPPNLHLQTLNPLLAASQARLPVVIPTSPFDWPRNGAPRAAGVSSFGFGGTNAHVVLEEAPPANAPAASAPHADRPIHVVTLSARSPEGVAELAARMARHLDERPGLPLADIAYTTNTGRMHFAHRLAATCRSSVELREQLQSAADNRQAKGVTSGEAAGLAPKIAFLFTGQGSQYAGMGRELFETQPVFRESLLRCQEILADRLEPSLLAVMYPDAVAGDLAALLDQTGYAQPAIFALEYALAELWRSWGIEPAAVLGHSVGEYVAACVAGAMSLEDGLALIAERGRLMQALPAGGSMAAVLAPEAKVAEVLAACGGRLAIAALNGPENTVISGPTEDMERVRAALAAAGITTKPLATSHAFHSPLLEPMLAELGQAASRCMFAPPRIELISNLTGRPVGNEYSDAGYWQRHARQPVRFAEGIHALRDRGFDLFLEIGPHPVLSGMGRRCVEAGFGTWLPSLRKGRSDWHTLTEGLAALYVRGAPVDWSGFDRGWCRIKVALPTYPFQRRSYWVAAGSNGHAPVVARGKAPAHPLLGRRWHAPIVETIFENRLSADRPALLADHRVYGKIVVPGAAWLEMSLAAAKSLGPGPVQVTGFSLREPLLLSERAGVAVQTVLVPEGGGAAAVRMVSQQESGDDEPAQWTTHATGRVALLNTCSTPAPIDLAELRLRFKGEPYDHAWRANALAASGLEPGPTFTWAEEHWQHAQATLARMRAPRAADAASDFVIHPGLLDCGIQLLGAALPGAGTGIDAFVPSAVGDVRVFARPEAGPGHDSREANGNGESWCHAELSEVSADSALGDIRFFDAGGRLLVELVRVRMQRVPRDWLQRLESAAQPDWAYELTWRLQELPTAATEPPSPGRWLLVADGSDLDQRLTSRLEADDQVCLTIPLSADASRTRHLVQEFLASEGPPYRGVVCLATHVDGPELDPAANALQACGRVLDVVQAIAEASPPQPPKLWLVTCGAQAVGAEQRAVACPQAALWGLARTLAVEYPDLHCTRVDLDGVSPPGEDHDHESLHREFALGGREDQVALRRGKRYVARLVRAIHSSDQPLRAVEGQPFRLEITGRGELGNLALRPVARRAPREGEIEIEVRAAGLNFRDVLNLLGLYPGDAGALGCECAGEVVAVGPGVQEFSIGDPVLALAPGSFAAYVTAPALFVVRKPEHLSFEQAAALPVAFVTAHYALRRLGRMAGGDRVLIHAATGGVGLAAVQLAQQCGAEVFATAGSPQKRAYLARLGIEHVMNSRTTEFADEVRRQTGGRGIDLLLNSLTGESILKGLEILAPGGRFLEIGKTDLWDEPRAHAVNPAATFHPIALDQMMADDPHLVHDLLQEVVSEFAAKRLTPPPQRVFPIHQAVEAFRLMARARHLGKVVLTVEADSTGDRSQLRLPAEASYLITGGLGGLGLAAARWLVDRGARALALVGRSAPSAAAAATLKELESAGVRVLVCQGDVSRSDDVARWLDEVDRELPPLRGVLHLAGVLDDGLLREQTRERFAKVMAPKVAGAWNLHAALGDRPLDWFVLFSSASSLLGSPGQANYAAANAFLDALAHHRQRQGLPALAVNWGNWAEVGMAEALRTSEGARWAASGVGWIEPARGFQTLERLLAQHELPQAGVVPIDWPQFFQRIPPGAEPAWLSEMAREAGAGGAPSGPPELLEKLKEVTPQEAPGAVLDFVRRQAAQVMGADAANPPDPARPLNELGFDSLMAVELCNALGRSIGQRLNPTLLYDYPTLDALAGHLVRDVLRLQYTTSTNGQAPVRDTDEDQRREQVLTEVEGLSENEMHSLVADAIAKLEENPG